MSETNQTQVNSDVVAVELAIDKLEKVKLMAVNISRTNYALYQRILAHCNSSIKELKSCTPEVEDNYKKLAEVLEEQLEKVEEPVPEVKTEGTDSLSNLASKFKAKKDS